MGFFFAEKENKKRSSKGVLSVGTVQALNFKGCTACTLNTSEKSLRNPKMAATGASRPLVYILGEAPGQEEDWQGEQFVGPAGKTLRAALSKADRDYKKFTRFNNVIRCHPPKNRHPSELEVECCRGYVVQDIEKSKPKVIIGTGATPLNWFLGGTPHASLGINKLGFTGIKIPLQVGNHTCWYFPVIHPSYVNRIAKRSEDDPYLIGFERAVRRAIVFATSRSYVDPVVVRDGYMDGITCLYGNTGDLSALQDFLDEASRQPYVAIDLETTGLRPYQKPAEDKLWPKKSILTCALSVGDSTVAFPIGHSGAPSAFGPRALDLLTAFLYQSKKTNKIAQNAQFELEWLAQFCGKNVVWSSGTWEDTVAQSYTVRETSKIHSLGLLTMRAFGFDVKSLSPPMSMGRLDQEPLEKILPYNGLDAKWEYKLFFQQKQELDIRENRKLAFTYRYQCDMAGALALTQAEGMDVDSKALGEQSKRLSDEEAETLAAIQRDKAAVAFQKAYGRPFSPTSNKDLPLLFRDVLGRREGVTVDRATGKEGYTTEEAMLSKIADSEPMASLILKLRHVAKLNSTYLVAVKDLVSKKGRLHTWYNSNLTSTGRLSSEDPNVQNFPSRKDKWVRKIVVARPGCKIVSFDYGQIDARNIAMASRDDFFCHALWDGYDIHQHWTEAAIKESPGVLDRVAREYSKPDATDEELTKVYRRHMKNSFTFPIFYGSTADQVAEPCMLPVRAARNLVEEFWGTMPGVLAWQEDLLRFYRRHGYVETLNGRRRHEPMKKNEILNSPIQGTTAEIVGNAMIRLSRMAYPEVAGKGSISCGLAFPRIHRRDYQPQLQVHDDITNNVKESSLDSVVQEIAKVMVDVPFDWVCVPIAVEVKAGYNWCDQEDVGVFSSDQLLGVKKPDWLS